MKPTTFYESKNKEIIKVCTECMQPFHKNWKFLKKLLIERLCKVILNGQNDDLLYEEDSFD